jgi:hypothetical protein
MQIDTGPWVAGSWSFYAPDNARQGVLDLRRDGGGAEVRPGDGAPRGSPMYAMPCSRGSRKLSRRSWNRAMGTPREALAALSTVPSRLARTRQLSRLARQLSRLAR